MDLILGNFADDNLDSLSSYDLKTYDQFLNENDNDLYDWCSKKIKAPKGYRPLIRKIMSLQTLARYEKRKLVRLLLMNWLKRKMLFLQQ